MRKKIKQWLGITNAEKEHTSLYAKITTLFLRIDQLERNLPIRLKSSN